MPRRTVLTTAAAAALAVLATTASAAPAPADELTYEQHDVRSNPKKGPSDHVTLDAPADWDRQRLSRVAVGFFNHTARPQTIVVDLDPLNDTVKEIRDEAQTLRDRGDRYYREYDFRVNDADDKVRVRWVFAYRDAQTGDKWSYTSVFLIGHERLEIDGRHVDKDQLKQLRTQVATSFEIQD